MIKMRKMIAILLAAAMLMMSGCRESDRVSYNVSKEADNFNVTRRLTVFNIRTDTVLMQMTGKMAIKNEGHDELSILVEVEKGKYQKHFVYLNEYTMYTVEDLNGTDVNRYAYELEFLPQNLVPVRISAGELKSDLADLVSDSE